MFNYLLNYYDIIIFTNKINNDIITYIVGEYMKIIEVENNRYNLIKDYRDAFDEDLFKEKYTDFFEKYDYIVGDIAYSKLRLKGFNNKKNKNYNKINDYCNVEKYILENCAYGCKYFILEKVYENNIK